MSRLNGGLPSGQAAWEEQHPGKSWATQRDLVLPGHREEWEAARHEGLGEVVGVTGDGTNDGPALRAAEVGRLEHARLCSQNLPHYQLFERVVPPCVDPIF